MEIEASKACFLERFLFAVLAVSSRNSYPGGCISFYPDTLATTRVQRCTPGTADANFFDLTY
eukprot:3579810-Rhodomonas_salina.2